jgi:hypothetical protein
MKKVNPAKITRYQMTGMFMPLNPASNGPVFLELDGEFLLPIFSTKEKFDEAAKWGGFTFAKCTVILEPEEFKNSVLQHKSKFNFHVAADLYVTPEGNTRFQLIPFDDEEKEYLNGQG